MSKKRYIDTKLWTDGYIEELDPSEKLVFIYLLTNNMANIAGVYELSIKTMSVQTGIEKEMIYKIMSRFEHDGKIVRHNNWIRIVNFQKHQKKANASVEKGINRVIEELPEDVRDSLYTDCTQSPTNLNLNLNPNLNPNLNLNFNKKTNKKSERESEDQDKPKKVDKNKQLLERLPDEAVQISEELHEKVRERYNFTKPRPNEVPRSADAIDKLHRLDGRDWGTIRAVMLWSQDDEFWQQNIRSGSNLRKHFDTLLVKIKSGRDKVEDSLTVI